MGSSSSRRSDKEVKEEAMADDDLQELPQLPIRSSEEEESSKEIKKERKKGNNNKKIKKRLYTVSPEAVEMILSINPSELRAKVGAVVDKIVAKEEEYCDLVGAEVFGSLKAALLGGQGVMRDYEKLILARQEKIRHDLETKGRVTYEAVDEIADDDVAAAAAA